MFISFRPLETWFVLVTIVPSLNLNRDPTTSVFVDNVNRFIFIMLFKAKFTKAQYLMTE